MNRLADSNPRKQPYVCPICKGTGTVPAGFYGPTYHTAPVTCRGCIGTGIVKC